MVKGFTCILTEQVLKKPCPVKTCAYYSNINATRCCAAEAEDMSLDELQVHKGIGSSLSDLSRMRKQAVKNVSNALLVYHFLQWAQVKPAPTYRKKLKDVLIAFGTGVTLFYIEEMEWTYDKLAKVLSKSLWEEFFKTTNASPREIHDILGMRESRVRQLISCLKEQHNEQANTDNQRTA